LSLLCQLPGLGDVCLLRLFAASGEQQNQQISLSLQIDAVIRSVIDAQLADALTDRLYVSKVAQREAADADLDARPRIFVAQFAKPGCEDFGLANLDQLLTIVHRLSFFKGSAVGVRAVSTPPEIGFATAGAGRWAG
jgi:hypothetical protein